MKLLVIEDDLMIGESLVEGLQQEKYQVDWVTDGLAAEVALASNDYQLVLLDLGLPKKQGLDVLTKYRQSKGSAAILIVTARDATFDRIKGLDTGADDYLVKPFDLDELYARIRALLRRCHIEQGLVLKHCGLQLNTSTHEVFFNGEEIHLSLNEFNLLLALLETPGKVISKAKLEEKIYGEYEDIESNTIEVYIHMLRKKVGAEFIKNVRGVGYKLMNAIQT